MIAREHPDWLMMAAKLTAAVAGFGGAYLVLALIATPGGYSERMSQLRQQAAEVGARLGKASPPTAFPAEAVCRLDPSAESLALKKRLQAAAASAGVNLANLSVSPGAMGQGGLTLTPIGVRFEVNGRYDLVLGMLDALANARPVFFVDTTELRSKVSEVDFKFSGRVFCAGPA